VTSEAGTGDADVVALYTRAYPRLVGVLTLVGGSRPDAEEIAQEAFARLLVHWGRVSAYEDPEGWVRTVAVRMLVSRRRRQRVASLGLARLARQPAPAGGGDPPEERLDVLAALGRLTAPQRAVVVLHHLLDLPVERVAADLGVPVGTVKSRLARARAALATDLSADEPADLSTDRMDGSV
jgi:RNA polymerase sigma-70 factor (ECF subfamily)